VVHCCRSVRLWYDLFWGIGVSTICHVRADKLISLIFMICYCQLCPTFNIQPTWPRAGTQWLKTFVYTPNVTLPYVLRLLDCSIQWLCCCPTMKLNRWKRKYNSTHGYCEKKWLLSWFRMWQAAVQNHKQVLLYLIRSGLMMTFGLQDRYCSVEGGSWENKMNAISENWQ
jgi:hypothetical protein